MGHTIHFVGAGLSKSLEVNHPVPLMADFIRVAAHYAENDTKAITLLALVGLELLDRFKWPSPSARQFAKAIDPRNLNAKVVKQFCDELRRRPAESIEDLLANDAPTSDAANEAVYSPVIRFRYAISRIFSQIGWQVDLSLLEKFVRRAIESGGRHTFVSFNYDLYLDRVVQTVCATWHWHCGYGVDIPYCITTDPSDHGEPVNTVPGDHQCFPDVRVLKPHGSLHWLLPVENPNASMPFGGGPVTVRLDDNGRPEYVRTTINWPKVKYPQQLPTDVAPGIIAPLRRKDAQIPIFVKSRSEEFDAVRIADEAFVLGWSLPLTDEDQRCLIGYAVQLRAKPFQRVVVINLNQPPEYFDRIARTFGVPRSAVEVWNAGFKDYLA